MHSLRSAIFAGLLSLASVSPAASTSFKVMTYNLGLLSIPFKGDAVKFVAERAKKLPAALAKKADDDKLDLIVLQEVWEKDHAEKIAEALKDFTAFRPGPEKNFLNFGHGLMLFARDKSFKITKKEYIGFRELSPLEKVGTAKGFLATVLAPVKAEENAFVFLTSHMQVLMKLDKDGAPTVKEEAAAQAAQIEQLVEIGFKFSDKGDLPVLFAGDTNCGPTIGKANYELFAKMKYTNAVLEKNKETPLTWDKENPLVKSGEFKDDPSDLIDHVLYTNGKKRSFKTESCQLAFQDPKEPLSDHNAMICQLVLE